MASSIGSKIVAARQFHAPRTISTAKTPRFLWQIDRLAQKLGEEWSLFAAPSASGWGVAEIGARNAGIETMLPGQAEQFAALWTAAQPTISAFIRTLVPHYQQSDEVLQRVAVALVRKFGQYDPSRPFGAWAIGVAKYEVLYYRRERATDRHLFSDELVEQFASRYELFVDEIDPIREALRLCLDELQGRSKKAIELRYRRGLRSDAIATEMALSPGAVRTLLYRVREKLRHCIERRIAAKGGVAPC